jgi:hypothetical protein
MTSLALARAGRRHGMRSFEIEKALARAWKPVPIEP